MTVKDDFIWLFDEIIDEIKELPQRFELRNFNYMVTSQRTTEQIFRKLERIDQNEITGQEHQNFWADLRLMGLVDQINNEISEFGQATLEYFKNEEDDFKREYFILSSIHRREYDIPDNVCALYYEKVQNLTQYLEIIPESFEKGSELINNEEKIYFTECLNTFPSVLTRYFQLTPERQNALDTLHESGLKDLFDEYVPSEAPYYNIARRFWNVCRAYNRRTNFIKSYILSRYEEEAEKNPDNKIIFKILNEFSNILNEELLLEIIKQSERVDPTISTKILSPTLYEDEALPMPTNEEIREAITEIKNTLLVEDSLIYQIVSSLVSGKDIILEGPIGTGKTHLAMLIPEIIWKNYGGYYPEVVTATADWSTHDVIGGIFPKIDDNEQVVYKIQKGCVSDTVGNNWIRIYSDLKRCKFYKDNKQYRGVWLIIDELNRANIDKAFGELITALEYRKIKLPTTKMNRTYEEIVMPQDYRIIATLNTFDKHYLFQISDGLKRRFTHIEMLPPTKRSAELEKYYILKRSAKDLPIKPSIVDRIFLNEETKEIDRDRTDQDLLQILDAAHEMFSFIRLTKNLGTAILITIFSYVMIDSEVNTDIENSLDNAFNFHITPQLENVSKWSLEVIRSYCCESVVELLRRQDPAQSAFYKYEEEFGKVLRHLERNNIQVKLGNYRTNSIRDEEWSNYDPWEGKYRPRLPNFGRSLNDFIREFEIMS